MPKIKYTTFIPINHIEETVGHYRKGLGRRLREKVRRNSKNVLGTTGFLLKKKVCEKNSLSSSEFLAQHHQLALQLPAFSLFLVN
jgi:hypothetical protein